MRKMTKKDTVLLSDDLVNDVTIQVNTIKKSKRSTILSKIINVMIENNHENILQYNRSEA